MKQIRNIIGTIAVVFGIILMAGEPIEPMPILRIITVKVAGIALFVGGIYVLKGFNFQRNNNQ